MSLPGMIHTVDVYNDTAMSDGYGGVASSGSTPAVSGWKCRICEDAMHYSTKSQGRGGRSSWIVVGDPTPGVTIVRGSRIVHGSEQFNVIEVFPRKDHRGNFHHWRLRMEKIL